MESHKHIAETTPLRHPEHYQYDFNLPEIAEVWRHGSVIGSWLLDLTAIALSPAPHSQRLQVAWPIQGKSVGR
jgi:6-phosphogluconate dehydrogenase